MPKKQQQLVILGVLALVMAAVYARALRPAPPSRAPSALPAAAAASAVPPAVPNEPAGTVSLELPAESGPRRAQREHAATLAWGRDPFTGGSAGGEVSGFDLSGILWDPSQPIAIINGQMLRVGEELEGYRVLAITQDTVSLSDGGQPLNLTIPQ